MYDRDLAAREARASGALRWHAERNEIDAWIDSWPLSTALEEIAAATLEPAARAMTCARMGDGLSGAFDRTMNAAVGDRSAPFERPTLVERLFNRAVGALVRLGIGLSNMRVLEVRGRKSGTIYSLPVDLLVEGGKQYLVAPRGRAQWVRNAEANGEITLRRGRRAERYRMRALADAEKPPILKAYLDRFHREVHRFFPVPAGSPTETFVRIAERYPAFELTRADER